MINPIGNPSGLSGKTVSFSAAKARLFLESPFQIN
jgi:hypothetical protein